MSLLSCSVPPVVAARVQRELADQLHRPRSPPAREV